MLHSYKHPYFIKVSILDNFINCVDRACRYVVGKQAINPFIACFLLKALGNQSNESPSVRNAFGIGYKTRIVSPFNSI